MASIDTSKIEGYDTMTAEEKVKAFESFNIPDPDYSGYVKKEVFDKKASEAAKLEKDLKARMTEEEKQMIAAFAEKIDVENTTQILQYGADRRGSTAGAQDQNLFNTGIHRHYLSPPISEINLS